MKRHTRIVNLGSELYITDRWVGVEEGFGG